MANTVLCTFSGFLITNPPPYWAWVAKISYVTYAYQGLVQNEFNGLKLEAKSGAPVPASVYLPETFRHFTVPELLGIVGGITFGNIVFSFLATLVVVRFRKNL